MIAAIRLSLAGALTLAAAGVFLVAAPQQAAAHGTHYNCEIHDFRPYPHRHIDPGAAVVNCDRQVRTGAFSTAAICEALARRRGGTGGIVDGTLSNSAVPLLPSDGGPVRAEALNVACGEALAACEDAKYVQGPPGAACQVIDQRFAQ